MTRPTLLAAARGALDWMEAHARRVNGSDFEAGNPITGGPIHDLRTAIAGAEREPTAPVLTRADAAKLRAIADLCDSTDVRRRVGHLGHWARTMAAKVAAALDAEGEGSG